MSIDSIMPESAFYSQAQILNQVINFANANISDVVLKLEKMYQLEKHNAISPALLLIFDNHNPMPIRENKWLLYFDLLFEYGIKIVNF